MTTVERHAPGLYTVGSFAVSRECEDRSCGCERYAVRPHYGDPLAEMGDWLSTRRLLKDALAVAQKLEQERHVLGLEEEL